jgi:DNA topoisomerase-1
MANAKLHTTSVDIKAGDAIFKTSGYTVAFKGFMSVYEDLSDDKRKNTELPELNEGDVLKVKSLDKNQHFTQPPARYNEASLIKTLEELGIGRPSTYAPTISTITSRMYVEKDGKQLKPTALGEVTTELMKDCFTNIVDAKFTAQMESDLDAVERGEKDWVESLEDFYKDFSKSLTDAEEKMDGKRVKVPYEPTDQICELCGKPLVIKIGRYGKFLACSGFPECTNTRKIVQETSGVCPLCGEKIILKKSKKGRSFYGCSGYPDCNFMTWNLPTEEKCPDCKSTLFQKGGKMGRLICEKPGCGYERSLKK